MRRAAGRVAAVILALAACALPGCAADRDAPAARLQATFDSPGEAARALQRAAKASDAAELRRILGRGSAALVESGDEAEDELARDRFARQFARGAAVQPTGDGSAVLLIGAPPRPFPVPLVHWDGRWRFAAGAGVDERVARRVARNEEAAIEALRGLAAAYRAQIQAGSGVPLPALPPELGGDHDGSGPRSPLRGYFFRILPDAAEGGFVMVAYPALHGASGVRTFCVGPGGVIRAKNLGPRTAQAARAIDGLRIDRTWSEVAPGQDSPGALPPGERRNGPRQ